MTRQQLCALAVVTAMFFLTGIAVWKLGGAQMAARGGSGEPAAILSTSVILYLAYLFSTLPSRPDRRNSTGRLHKDTKP